ncbi:MAP/microtubule affinity-regulating kinase 3-like isoform X2 [Ictidomys tridecemlineatus]
MTTLLNTVCLQTVKNDMSICVIKVMETNEYIYLIMEHTGGGQLMGLILQNDGMQDEEAHRLFRQIVHAMQYFHQKGIVHLDLKPENMGVDTGSNITFIDFDLSTRFTAGKKLKRFFGTVLHVAPEIIQEKEYKGPQADIWSLGLLLYAMLTGKCSFEASNNREVKKLIKQGTYDILPRLRGTPELPL